MAIEAAIGKLNSQALSKAVEKSDGESKVTGGANQSFKDVLGEMNSGGKEMMDMLGIDNGQMSTQAKMESISAENIDFAPSETVTGLDAPSGSSRVVNMLSEVNKGQLQMDSLVNHVMYSGKRFSNQELLVIQAHVFHFAQMSELTVKVAEQGVSSVKTVLNTQIQ